MNKRFTATAIVLTLFSIPQLAQATCSSGFTLNLAGQLPDFTFQSGVPQTIRFNPWYVSFVSNSGSCGIFARSTTPGVSLQGTYGCSFPGCPIAPPGVWAPVGDAYQPLFTEVSHKSTDIPIIFDGTTPPGTYGTIEIAIRDNDLGIPSQFVIGTANVYVESATPPATWFGVSTNAGNVSGDRVVIDHPYLNGKPGAKLFVSHVRNPGGSLFGTSWNHPIAVVYDSGLARWTIRNVDGFAMPTGLGFGVRYDPTASVYCTPSSPGVYASVTIDHPYSNNSVWATVLVTPIGGRPQPIAVRFDTPYWRIVYSDGQWMDPGTCFNVKALAFTQYLDDPAAGDFSARANVTADWGTGVDLGGTGVGHNSGAGRYLQFDWALGNPSRQVMWTYNLTPLGFHAIYDPKFFGVLAPSATVGGGRWAVYHEDATPMILGARFNVWAPCAAAAWYPDADGDGYGGPGQIQASCAPLPGYASRSGDCDDANATRYPGSPEINDGQDNQCPGAPGSGLIDEISKFDSFGDRETFCWTYQGGATSYQLARSNVRSFSTCSIVAATNNTCTIDATVPSSGQAFYYLVRAGGPWLGTWGANSAGVARGLSCP